VENLYPKMLDINEAKELYKHVTLTELKVILKMFKKEKSLGPNGWSVELYLHFFEIMGEDLLDLVEETQTSGRINGSINSTFIAMIPKRNKKNNFGDYRTISLCNLVYKVISKVIANRIKPVLSRFLLEEQLGFLGGRQIQDIIGTTHECIHSIKKKKQKSLILKLDLQKVYDYISWDYLRMVLIEVGFGIHMTNWILACVNSTSFVVLVNGKDTDFLRSGRDLRQGFPLSSLLFILVMESLSLLLKQSQRQCIINGIKVARITKILHILFIDDIFLLSKASIQG
jgi:hypothetical protein